MKIKKGYIQFVKPDKYSECHVFLNKDCLYFSPPVPCIFVLDLWWGIGLITLHTFHVRGLFNLGENFKFNLALQGKVLAIY